MTAFLSTANPGDTGPGAVRDAWLFTRGAKSVRIIRAAAASRMFLHVFGPGSSVDSHIFDDVICCMRYQADIERQLVSRGFSLERFATERRLAERRTISRGPGRRKF